MAGIAIQNSKPLRNGVGEFSSEWTPRSLMHPHWTKFLLQSIASHGSTLTALLPGTREKFPETLGSSAGTESGSHLLTSFLKSHDDVGAPPTTNLASVQKIDRWSALTFVGALCRQSGARVTALQGARSDLFCRCFPYPDAGCSRFFRHSDRQIIFLLRISYNGVLCRFIRQNPAFFLGGIWQSSASKLCCCSSLKFE